MRWCAALLALAACAPYYRDAETEGRRADDRRAYDRTMEAAYAASAAGDHARALELVRRAIHGHPAADVSTYRFYAVLLSADGRPEEARAVIRFALEHIAPGSQELRDTLATSYVIDGRLGAAIAALELGDVAQVTHPPELVIELDHLQGALSATSGADARRELAAWYEHHGCSDDALIAAAVEQVQTRIWAAATTSPAEPELEPLAGLLDDAAAFAAAGERDAALEYYAEALRVLPPAVFEAHAAQASAVVGEAIDVDAAVYVLVDDAERALAEGDLGAAIRALRRALARAPWWRDGHAYLAELLDAIGEPGGAAFCRGF